MQATDDQSLKAPPVARAALPGLPPWQAPRQGTEATLAGFFTRELNLDTVGSDDDFFALGGTSLQAAAIFGCIARELGTRLPLATLYRAPTIRQLAAAVDKAMGKASVKAASMAAAAQAAAIGTPGAGQAPAHADDSRCVQLIQPGSSAHALFIAPGIGGDIVGLGHVVRHLDPTQSVYGLRSIGLQAGEEPLADMPAIAAAFISEIRRVQPAGPYQLFGVCWGTLVCLEIARQLEAAGETVSLLALLDPPPVGGGASAPAASAPSRRHFLRQRLALYGKSLSATPLRAWPAYLWGRAVNVADALRKRDPFRGDASEYLRWRVREANLRAMRAYEPPPFGGDACLLFTQDRADGRSKAARDYWIRHVRAQGREQYVPGKDSGDALAPERAAAVAARLSGCLAKPPAGTPAQAAARRPASAGG